MTPSKVAAGKLNAPPGPNDSAFQLNINTRGRLSSVDDFKDIIVRTDAGWEPVTRDDLLRERTFKNAPLQLVLEPSTSATPGSWPTRRHR